MRIGYTGDDPPPSIPAPVLKEVSKRCVASYKVINGMKELEDFDLKSVDLVVDEL